MLFEAPPFATGNVILETKITETAFCSGWNPGSSPLRTHFNEFQHYWLLMLVCRSVFMCMEV